MNKNSIVKEGFKEAHKRFVVVSLPLSFFAVLTILMLILAYFVPLTLILSLPFVIIPAFFAVAAINTFATNKNTHEGIGFFVMFRSYFSQIFRGGYKVIRGLLKAFLVFLVSSIVFSVIFATTILAKDPGYIAFTEEIKNITEVEALSAAIDDFIINNETINEISILVNCLSTFFALYMFMHHFGVNSVKYNYNFVAKMPLPMQDLNVISKKVHKENRKGFYKDYYKAFWFLGVILTIGYFCGSLLAYFFIKNANMIQIAFVGLFGSFILLLFFVPYFLNASIIIISGYRKKYFHTLIELSKKSLQEMKRAKEITDDKEKEVIELLESQNDVDKDEKDSDKK